VGYIHREFKDAFDGNIIRYLKGKKNREHRLVPLRAAAEAHVDSQETAMSLAGKGVTVMVIDNSGPLGSASLKDLGFLQERRYTTRYGRDESQPEEDPAYPRGNQRIQGEAGTRDGGGTSEGPSGDRARATERLIEEGKAVLDRYFKEGKLTKEEVDAFLR
jgi:hypothetical protein